MGRTGRGTPIDRKSKEKVWAVFAAYRAKLDQEGWSERNAVTLVLERRASCPRFRFESTDRQHGLVSNAIAFALPRPP